jgi:phage I-like protein
MHKYNVIIGAIEPAKDCKPPETFLLFKAGEVELDGGDKIIVDRAAFDLVAAKMQRQGNDIVIDYEHQTVKDVKSPAAGWIKGLEWSAAGIRAKSEWTEEAAAYIAKKEYRYFSPVFFVRRSDRRLAGLHSVALTNAPKTHNLQPLLAKLGAQADKEETSMEFLKKIAAALGLAEGATEEQAIEAAKSIKEKSGKPEVKTVIAKGVIDALGLDDNADERTVVAGIHALKQKEKGMVSRTEFDALQAKLTTRDADDAVKTALAAGKITPDQKDWAVNYAKADLAGFNVFVAKAPVVIPVGKLPEKTETGHTGVIDDSVRHVAKLMGVDDETLKKYGK